MGDKSAIEWCDATWNPTIGCTRVSAGCDHCYAFQLHDQRHVAWKRGRWPDAPQQYHQPFSRVQLLPERLDQPLRWTRPRRIFVNSLSDLFHDQVPDEFIARVFAVMALAPQHTFQILTKRPERMRGWVAGGRDRIVAAGLRACDEGVNDWSEWAPRVHRHRGWWEEYFDRDVGWPLRNVWLGVSVEDQAAADERIPLLLRTPAAVRFLSCEPLLGPVDLGHRLHLPPCPQHPINRDLWGHLACDCAKHRIPLHWVIAGGESGPHARPMHPDWARQLRDQCRNAGVAFHFKQWGEWAPPAFVPGLRPDYWDHCRLLVYESPSGQQTELVRAGKKVAGRVLDGRTYDEFPTAAVPA